MRVSSAHRDGFWFGQGFTLTATGETFVLGNMQEHGSMQEPQLIAGRNAPTRPLYREATIEEYRKNPQVDRGDAGGSGARLDLPPAHLGRFAVGHGDRSGSLHRLQRLRGGLPGGEQRTRW